jgi:hypothetical protein
MLLYIFSDGLLKLRVLKITNKSRKLFLAVPTLPLFPGRTSISRYLNDGRTRRATDQILFSDWRRLRPTLEALS